MTIRKPIVNGIFYPNDPLKLKEDIKNYLSDVKNIPSIRPKAIVVPHAGYPYSGGVASYSFKLLENTQYKTIILLGPSHQFYFQKFCFCQDDYFETPLGKVPVIPFEELLKNQNKEIQMLLKDFSFLSKEIHQEEHSLEVQLPFLQIILKDFKIIPILISYLPEKTEGMVKILKEFLKEENSLLVVSTDLSHYYPYKQAIKRDKKTINYILEKDEEKLKEEGDACGLNALILLVKLAKEMKLKPILLKYLNSGDVTGNYQQVVGYTAIAFQ